MNGEKKEGTRGIKILAPVGGREQLIAAVRCGADAVYLGAKGFNARQNAENFEAGSLPESVAYCHERDVQVYVTLNTLVMDGELPELVQTLDEIAAAGADAVIVQDLAVAALVRRRYPSLPLFASTQMSIHNGEGAVLAQALGFSQVVLARELSMEEIRAIRAAVGLELEAFVHGALCMCVSGMCYLSAMIGTRSGNRGLCAQPCRLNFRLNGRQRALSLKDMSHIRHIPALAEAGIGTLKIEGRMKRPEYVAAAVTACRAAREGRIPDLEALRAVFSRSGFTDGYLTGRRTLEMFGVRTREDVTAAASVLPALAALYEREPQNIDVAMDFAAAAGEPVRLRVSDGVREATVNGPVPEAARTLPLTAESVEKNLTQTGGTPYRVVRCAATLGEGLALPVSAQKKLRRDALAALGRARSGRPVHESTGYLPPALPAHDAPEAPAIRLRFSGRAQLFDAPAAEKILLPIEEIAEDPGLIAALGGRLVGELPALCFPSDMAELRETLARLKTGGLSEVSAENIGMLALGRELGFAVHGGAGLNILNSHALAAYASLGLADATVSFELSMRRIGQLRGALKRGLIAYGYLPLMHLRACPARGVDGCGVCTGIHTLTDEKNQHFTMLCHGRRYQELLNSVPLYLGDKPMAKVDFLTLRFTVESREAAQTVYGAFLRREAPDFRRTAGLYFRQLQ